MTSAVPLTRSERSSAPSMRSITILGATGSIGASTIDLIRRNRGRFRVEALTAARNAGALAKLARELNASFAAVADASCYAELKSALDGRGGGARRDRRARQQGNAGVRRQPVHAPRRGRRGDRAAGRFRAQRDL